MHTHIYTYSHSYNVSGGSSPGQKIAGNKTAVGLSVFLMSSSVTDLGALAVPSGEKKILSFSLNKNFLMNKEMELYFQVDYNELYPPLKENSPLE